MSDEVITHLEQHLGVIEEGWSLDPSGEPMPFQVVRFAGREDGPGTVYSTLGLHKHGLRSRTSSKTIRHELVMIEAHGLSELGIPNLLQQLGLEAIKSEQAYLRGDVIGPRGKLWARSEMEALYVSLPVCFPDSFAACGPVVFAWIFPITAAEARYVREQGFRAFEARLLEQDPNLVDIYRSSVTRDALH